MTSYLLTEYRRHLEQGHTHRGALKALARRFSLDLATAGRVIERAERLIRDNADMLACAGCEVAA